MRCLRIGDPMPFRDSSSNSLAQEARFEPLGGRIGVSQASLAHVSHVSELSISRRICVEK